VWFLCRVHWGRPVGTSGWWSGSRTAVLSLCSIVSLKKNRYVSHRLCFLPVCLLCVYYIFRLVWIVVNISVCTVQMLSDVKHYSEWDNACHEDGEMLTWVWTSAGGVLSHCNWLTNRLNITSSKMCGKCFFHRFLFRRSQKLETSCFYILLAWLLCTHQCQYMSIICNVSVSALPPGLWCSLVSRDSYLTNQSAWCSLVWWYLLWPGVSQARCHLLECTTCEFNGVDSLGQGLECSYQSTKVGYRAVCQWLNCTWWPWLSD